VIDLYVGDIAGKTVLEIGCHVGASMVVLATLGAKVTGIEINEGYGRLTEFNLRRYGLEEPKVIVLPSAPPLPFSDSSFDLVCCNSVLEYVSPSDLCFMMKEIGRVVRPGGIVLILGTSNRLWPCEGHSHRWFVNYVPRSLDRFLGHSWARGVFPWQLSGPLADLEAIDQSGRLYGELHRRFGAKHSRKAVFVTAMSLFARCIGISPGRLGPSILAVLRRRVPR
jgi:SAM-dependent methyltransferase